MSKLMPVVALVVVAGLAFFGLKSAGVIGGPAELTDEQVSERLAGYADKINAEDGLSFDDWSKLSSARHIEKTITIRGETIMDAEKLAPDYFDSRRPQIVNILCHDEALRPTLSHATYNFNWFSADNKPLGDMITIRGDDTCAGSDPS